MIGLEAIHFYGIGTGTSVIDYGVRSSPGCGNGPAPNFRYPNGRQRVDMSDCDKIIQGFLLTGIYFVHRMCDQEPYDGRLSCTAL